MWTLLSPQRAASSCDGPTRIRVIAAVGIRVHDTPMVGCGHEEAGRGEGEKCSIWVEGEKAKSVPGAGLNRAEADGMR
jgi:hypothetical protein